MNLTFDMLSLICLGDTSSTASKLDINGDVCNFV